MKISEETKKILSTVQKDLHLKNTLEAPRLIKVTIAVGVWSLATRKGMKDFSEVEKNIQIISWQKPHMTVSKKAISNFKLREGMPSMIKVTLRRQKAYDFLTKVAKIVMPRVRDFSGLSKKSFDTQGGYSIGIKSYSIFPEFHPDDITMDVGLQISIQTTSTDIKRVQKFLETVGFVFHE